jgi:hypothetical protein
VALSSEVTGTGHSIGDLDAAILLELVEGGPDGLAERVDGRLASSGRSLLREGKPIGDPAERLRLVGESCATFRSVSLPQLVQLGIAAGA